MVRKGGSLDDLEKRASLLRRDSVHGRFDGVIDVDHDENALVVNGNMIRVIYSDGPDEVDYTQYGIHDALVVDNTGSGARAKIFPSTPNHPGPRKWS